MTALVELDNVKRYFESRRGPFGRGAAPIKPVGDVSFAIEPCEVLGRAATTHRHGARTCRGTRTDGGGRARIGPRRVDRSTDRQCAARLATPPEVGNAFHLP